MSLAQMVSAPKIEVEIEVLLLHNDGVTTWRMELNPTDKFFLADFPR